MLQARILRVRLWRRVQRKYIHQTQQYDKSLKDEGARLQIAIAEMQKQVDEMGVDNRTLRDKLAVSNQQAVELEAKLAEAEKKSYALEQEVVQARNELSASRSELLRAKESISTSQSRIDSLQYALADREARLTEASASVERERECFHRDARSGTLSAHAIYTD